ncbi:MAG: GntR family transcriptional regulator [Spirochaetes bacterium]|nr:GntR family transcriptional regulator [Spirochaetota bacterium]
MSNIKSITLRQKAYKLVKDRIINLYLKPGDKISETELTKTLKISRTPIREALLMLEHEKLLECNNSMGFIVRRLTLKEVDEYYTVRGAIENFVLSLVVENITDEEMKSLHANVKAGDSIVKGNNIHKIIKCESEFHEMLYKAAKSDVLLEIISPLTDKFQWFRGVAFSIPGSAANSLSQHKIMLELIEKKDLKGLRHLMKEHLKEAKRKVKYLSEFLF